jgi:hypothetical protein
VYKGSSVAQKDHHKGKGKYFRKEKPIEASTSKAEMMWYTEKVWLARSCSKKKKKTEKGKKEMINFTSYQESLLMITGWV